MAKNFLVLAILCTSSVFLSVGVFGEEIYNVKVNKTTKKAKRAIEDDNNNFSKQNYLIPHSPGDDIDSNEVPPTTGPLQDLSIAKRAPSGFTGMRGKKQQEFTDLSPNDLDWGSDEDYFYNDLRNKKAPSGFNGVRGKKMDRNDYEANILDQLLHRLHEEYLDRQEANTYRYNSPLYSLDYPLSDDWDKLMEKRTPVGFTGMRGKRPLIFPFDGGKRNPNAFFGVRGKRDFKRSTMQQFNSRFFGTRGKKQPGILGFRNKFVGVRGKKDGSGSALNRLESQLIEIPFSHYRSSPVFLVDPPEFVSLKRAPNGFMGMRGKREVNLGAMNDDLLNA